MCAVRGEAREQSVTGHVHMACSRAHRMVPSFLVFKSPGCCAYSENPPADCTVHRTAEYVTLGAVHSIHPVHVPSSKHHIVLAR
jgi:hypothetical protein